MICIKQGIIHGIEEETKMKKTIIAIAILASIVLGTFGFLNAYSKDKPFFNMFSIAREVSESKGSLVNYKNKVNKVLDRIKKEKPPQENYFVTITFSRYMNKEDIKGLVDKYNIKVLAIEGRSIEKGTNLKGTFFVAPENGMLYDRKSLFDMLQRNNSEFKGFISVIVNIKNEDIQKLRNDKIIFLIDPSADTHFVSNPKHEKTNSWDGYAPSLFSELEKNKLLNP